ncbi:MAG: hypothetical protein KJO07_04400, partial [Deltaproteobacteria bacterium]|nr:hypothetical protein [Deltaproteobacteria bacterium]
RVDSSVTKAAVHPFAQIITGGAGAPYYQQETHVPWTGKVARFSTRQHYVRIEVSASGAVVKAIDIGGKTFDEFQLPLRQVLPPPSP